MKLFLSLFLCFCNLPLVAFGAEEKKDAKPEAKEEATKEAKPEPKQEEKKDAKKEAKDDAKKESKEATKKDAKEDPDAEFQKVADEYVKGWLAAHPLTATSLGLHEYDGRMSDFTRLAIDAELSRLRRFEERLSKFDT